MDYLLDALQLAGLAYLAWRVHPPKPSPEVPMADIARAIAKHHIGSGRARLRARLAAKAAKREANQ